MKPTPERASHGRVASDLSRARRASLRRHAVEMASDEEAVMMAIYSIGLALLGIAPLMAFLLIYYWVPGLLSFLDGPRTFP